MQCKHSVVVVVKPMMNLAKCREQQGIRPPIVSKKSPQVRRRARIS
jgi:hypothetical protein